MEPVTPLNRKTIRRFNDKAGEAESQLVKTFRFEYNLLLFSGAEALKIEEEDIEKWTRTK